jgi:hypothetical protein
VRQVLARTVDQLVDPLDADRRVEFGFNRQRRCVEHQRTAACGVSRRAISPHRRHRHAWREDLLFELAHRDLVVVDAPGASDVPFCDTRHCGRNEQRCTEFGYEMRVERAARNLREQADAAGARVDERGHTAGARDPDEVSSFHG